jgi:hypothetical protein
MGRLAGVILPVSQSFSSGVWSELCAMLNASDSEPEAGVFDGWMHVNSAWGHLHVRDLRSLHADANSHWTTTDFAVNDELSIALVRIEGDFKPFAAVRTGDRHKLTHGMKYNGKNRGTIASERRCCEKR